MKGKVCRVHVEVVREIGQVTHKIKATQPNASVYDLRQSFRSFFAAIWAISRAIVGWFRVTYEELMGMLGGALKAGIPMESQHLE